MLIGDYEIHLIKSGEFRLDGGAMFGVIPKTLWQKEFPADERNRILLALNTLLVVGKGRIILIDTGIGQKFSEKYVNIYGIDFKSYSLQKSLSEKNIQPEDITDVILTHLHFDHAGGATYLDSTGELNLQFPNAIHYIHEKQLEWAQRGFEKDRASYLPENLTTLLSSKKLKKLKSGGKLFNGIEIIISNGHTPGQQMVLISHEEKKLFYASDLFPTSAHVQIPWIMAYDLEPLVTIKEKKEILKKAVAENWMIFFEHDPKISCATIKKMEQGYQVGDIMIL
jgi:glyoxylase-like metal-dependent hydrolase (beta-lactamase superfamily II)